MNDRPSAAVRIRVMKRDRFMCTYCGVSGNNAELEIDHIIPISKGGSNHMSNLTTSCRACNMKKGVGLLEKMNNGKIGNEFNALLDKPVHMLKDGQISYQAIIIGKDDDDFLIQRFSFFDGSPTDIITIPKTDLFNPKKFKIYANDHEWHKAYFMQREKENGLSGTVEQCIEGTFSKTE